MDSSDSSSSKAEFVGRLKDPHYVFKKAVAELSEVAESHQAVSVDYDCEQDQLIVYYRFATEYDAWMGAILMELQAKVLFEPLDKYVTVKQDRLQRHTVIVGIYD